MPELERQVWQDDYLKLSKASTKYSPWRRQTSIDSKCPCFTAEQRAIHPCDLQSDPHSLGFSPFLSSDSSVSFLNSKKIQIVSSQSMARHVESPKS